MFLARIIHKFLLNPYSHPPIPFSRAARGRGGASYKALGTDPSPMYGRGDQGVREYIVQQFVPHVQNRVVNNPGELLLNHANQWFRLFLSRLYHRMSGRNRQPQLFRCGIIFPCAGRGAVQGYFGRRLSETQGDIRAGRRIRLQFRTIGRKCR